MVKKALDIRYYNKPSVILWLSVILFSADSAINAFYPLPLFVSSSPVLISLMLTRMEWKSRQPLTPFLLMALTILSAFINLMRSGFELSNLTDLVFIVLFACSWIYYSQNRSEIPAYTLQLLFWMSLILFSFSFFGFDSMAGISEDSIVTDAVRPRVVPEVTNEISVIEYIRIFRMGLFRLPHIAAYFWLFLSIALAYRLSQRRSYLTWAALLLSLFMLVAAGSRTAMVAPLLAIGLVLIERRKFVLPSLAILLLFIVISFRYELLLLSEDTVFFQYISLVVTSIDNWNQLSRVMLWKSWSIEMAGFNWADWLIGKSFAASFEANAVNLHFRTWFHNDFLSIAFAYGLPALLAYAMIFSEFYRNHRREIQHNAYVSVFFYTMIFAAIFNGYYYYFPVLLLPLIFIMLRPEDASSLPTNRPPGQAADETGH